VPKRRRRSRSVFGGSRGMALGEKLVYQVQAGEIRTDEFLQLPTRKEHEPTGRLEQYECGAFPEPRPFPQVSWDDEPSAVPHNDMIGPTHVRTIPHKVAWWAKSHAA